MSLAATVKAMAAAGFTAQQIDDVVSRMDEARRAKTRAGNAKRQAALRARRNANNGVTDVTSNADNAENSVTGVTTSPPSLLPSPTPPTNNSSPTPSLRSENIRAREGFDRFFAVYPKRINRKAALARWQTAVKAGVDLERMILAAERYAEHMRFTDPQFIKAPDAWLNAGKYDDELPTEPPSPKGRKNGGGWAELYEATREDGPNERANHPMRDITPAAADTDRSHDPSDLFEPAGRVSGGAKILDFGQSGSDVGGQAVAYGTSWRASG